MSADTIDDKTRTELEAAAFRTLVAHLRERTDVQNIDLMNLAGFCRNCLSKWYRAAAEERGCRAVRSRGARDRLRHAVRRMAQEASEGGDAGAEGGIRGFTAEALTPRFRIEGFVTEAFVVFADTGEGERMPDVGGIAGEQLRSFIERIERLEEEKRALSADIKDVYAEAKGSGFDIAIMRQIIRIRRMDQDDVDEQETLLDIYKRALGMLPDVEPRHSEAAE